MRGRLNRAIRRMRKNAYLTHVTNMNPQTAKATLFGHLSMCGISLSRTGRYAATEGANLARRLKELRTQTKRKIDQNDVLKSLLIKQENTGKYFLFVLPWAKNINPGKVSKLIKGNFLLVQRDLVQKLTGYPVGMVAPIPLSAEPIQVLIDQTINRQTDKYVPCGYEGERIRLTIPQIQKAVNATKIHRARLADII